MTIKTFEYSIGGTTRRCKATNQDEAFRCALDKEYGKVYQWLPEGSNDHEPDIFGRIWYRGYLTRRIPKANAHSIESPLLHIKIKPLS